MIKNIADISISVCTLLLAVMTGLLWIATRDLARSEKHHGEEELRRSTSELLFRLATVIDDVPNTSQCVHYLLEMDKSKITQGVNASNPIREIMSGKVAVRLLDHPKDLGAKKRACLGGLLIQTSNARLDEDAQRTYIRAQIKRYFNIIDAAAQRLEGVPAEEIEGYMKQKGSAIYQLASNLHHLHDKENAAFLSRWGDNGDNKAGIETFAICRIFSCNDCKKRGLTESIVAYLNAGREASAQTQPPSTTMVQRADGGC